MKQLPIPTPPPGFRYEGRLFADLNQKNKSRFRLFIDANLIALIPLGVGIVLLWLPFQFYRALGAPWVVLPHFELTLPFHILVWAVMIASSMIVHELIHALILRFAGLRPRILWYGGMLLASLPEGEYLSRRLYLIMSLSPVVALSLLGIPGLILLPDTIANPLLVTLLLNLAASTGDLMVADRVWRSPPNAVFTDDHGIQVFVPVV